MNVRKPETPPETGAYPYLILSDADLVRQCEVDKFRSHGPGGQKRNKTDSAVRLRHGPTGLMAIAVEDRSQHVNKARAIRRLRHTLALKLRVPIDPEAFVPSELLATYLVGGGLAVSPRNEQYPLILAELMDLIMACALRVSDVADRLGISTTNLLNQLRKDPAVWKYVNELRVAAGMKRFSA